MADERLAKLLSHIGIASRRRCEQIISSGRVTVNDVVVLDPGHRVSPGKDCISVDGRLLGQTLKQAAKPLYIALYKPPRYLSDLLSRSERPVARSLIPINTYLFPVGRLDYHSEGLMLFTNDGDLANRVMHPRYGMEKEYLVKFKGVLSDVALRTMVEGLTIEGTRYKVARVRFVRHSLANSWYCVVLTEGRNRMIRKIGEKIGQPVLKLKRIRIGPIKLGDLMPGQYRFLSAREVKSLMDAAPG
ncbi:MAG: Ribosomal large subunit pseudouridine synthase B [Syntrophorhabdus sp. PtaU1.Bin153]|nr:MAG: Ribosomal large subunit pseudouridine synthase B [Syntrophorhabdus sp. PtaU1.Bin153]